MSVHTSVQSPGPPGIRVASLGKEDIEVPKEQIHHWPDPKKETGLVCGAHAKSPFEEKLKDLEKPNIQIPVMTGILSSLSEGRAENYIPQPLSRTYSSERSKH